MTENQVHKLVPGQTVYQIKSYGMGNTTRRTLGVYEVRIIDIVRSEDGDVLCANASWNGNTPTRYSRSSLRDLFLKPPDLVSMTSGGQRRMTRAERAAIKAGTLTYSNGRLTAVPAAKPPGDPDV